MRIGSRKVIYSQSLLIPENQVGEFSIRYEELSINVEIVQENDKSGDQGARYDGEDGKLVITLTNWNNQLGTAFIEPVEFGTTLKGQNLSFLLAQSLFGKVSKVDLQVMLEDQRND